MKLTNEVQKHINDVLEDDTTPYGGTAFEGETLIDFLMSTDEGDWEYPITMKQVNEYLKENGIKEIKNGSGS